MIERDDAVNWSTLRFMRQSPKHYRHALTAPPKDTEALQRGRLTHCAIYEPDELPKRYVVEPRFHKGQNDDTAVKNGYEGGKQAAAAWAAENVGREVVSSDMMAAASAMAAALHADPWAAPMLRGGSAEQLITWTDRQTGIACRGRVDHFNGCLSDLKTSRSVEPRWFAAQVARMGYHAQLAFYADGLRESGVALAEPPALIVVENCAPYDVLVLTVPDEAIDAGRAMYRACLERLAECRRHDEWPGVSDGQRQTLNLPAWALPSCTADEARRHFLALTDTEGE